MTTGEFRMPSLGADMEVGTILEWRIKPGAEVHRGDIVALVDTEKADIEVEVFEDGIVEELLVDVGEQVPVGTLLARLTPVAERPPAAAAGAPPPPIPTEAPAAPEPAPLRRPPKAARPAPARPAPASTRTRAAAAAARVRASPLARRLAGERGVDLTLVKGSGPDGAVLGGDLAAGGDTPEPAPPTRLGRARADRQKAMRHAIGELMSRSKREIPHYYVATTIDVGDALAWLAAQNAVRPVTERVLPAAMLLRASALAAREVPELNGFWDGELRRSDRVHLGVAVGLRGGGLVAPAIHDADRLTVDELMAALRDLVERARAGRLRSSEMADPTLTVTNLGDQGAEEVLGVIYPPQVALVGFGRIVERPWASGGMLGVRPTLRASLAGDHRATDGHAGSRFLAMIDRLLHSPEDL
jgi:pyruvate dehydrogenase E2 component (dihydrolipoamide acetyltransferase)